MGWTSVPNVFFKLIPELSGRETKVLLAIIRKTKGFHKAKDVIPYSQLSEMTGIKPSHLKPVIESLEKKDLIMRAKCKGSFAYMFVDKQESIKWEE